MKRRNFLMATTAAGLSSGLALWVRARGSETPQAPPGRALKSDPKGLLDLPEGFRYRIVQRAGQTMSDGYRVPGRPDAMGCFALSGGRYALMRNHELDRSLLHQSAHPGAPAPPEAYDPKSAGAVTRVVLDARGRPVSSNLVLTGTARNCAGGVSPWGWLSCEESVEPGHGYVFVCRTHAETVQTPQRVVRYGRFMHEAAAIDPRDHAAYLTEDRMDGCLYRFVPHSRTDPFGPGSFSALAVRGRPGFDLGTGLAKDTKLQVSWVELPSDEVDRKDDTLRYRAREAGAAVVRRGEGIWAMQDGFAFTATQGGAAGLGQVFHLAPTPEGGTLRLIAESGDRRELFMPDNLTITPWGDLLVCEDNLRSPHLRLITQSGKVMPFAFNARSRSEFAGACFSPDGHLLFVNIQEHGLTLAIKGPWASLNS